MITRWVKAHGLSDEANNNILIAVIISSVYDSYRIVYIQPTDHHCHYQRELLLVLVFFF
jgi:hypothetical protein